MDLKPPPPPAPPAGSRPEEDGYAPPVVAWEEQFVALAQVSEPPCIPGQDPRCTP